MKLSKGKVIIISIIVLAIISSTLYFLFLTPAARAERAVEQAERNIENQEYEEGISNYKKALKLDPENINILLALGKTYMDNEDYSEAEALFKEILEIESDNYLAQEQLFNVYLLENKLNEAEALLQKLGKEQNRNVEPLQKQIDSAKATKEAESNFEQGLKFLDEKMYLEAINTLEKIGSESKLFMDAKDKIIEAGKLYSEQMVVKAKEAAGKGDYQTALDLLTKAQDISYDSKISNLHKEYTIKLNQILAAATAQNNAGKEVELQDTIVVDGFGEFTIKKAYFSKEVHPPNEDTENFLNSSVFYMAHDNYILLDVVTNLKNLQSSEARVDSFVNMVLLYNDKDTFNPIAYAAVEDLKGRHFKDTDRTFIDPSQTNTLHFIFNVPDSIQNENTPLALEFTINGSKYRCVVR